MTINHARSTANHLAGHPPLLDRQDWLIVAPLLALSFIPVAAGLYRLARLGLASTPAADELRAFADPVPIAIHIASTALFVVLGSFQVAPGLRRRRPDLHRIMGRLLVPSAVSAALSGLWLSFFFPLPETDGAALAVLRLIVGIAWTLFAVLGFVSILARDIPSHRAWMLRAYALGQGAGTQSLVLLTWMTTMGGLDAPTKAVLMGLAWGLNMAVAEAIIRGRGVGRPRLPGLESAAITGK